MPTSSDESARRGSERRGRALPVHSGADSLGAGRNDCIAAALRAGFGAVPGIGPALSEFATAIIPNQRVDRIEVFARHLAEELDALRSHLGDLGTYLREAGCHKAELFEAGIRVASRSENSDRIRQVARIVAEGLTADEEIARRERLLLDVVEQLHNDDIALLLRMLTHWSQRPRQPKPPQAPPPTDAREAFTRSLQDKRNRNVDEYQKARLVRLGLLAEQWDYDQPKRRLGGGTVVPPPRQTGHVPTRMAELVLQRLGILSGDSIR